MFVITKLVDFALDFQHFMVSPYVAAEDAEVHPVVYSKEKNRKGPFGMEVKQRKNTGIKFLRMEVLCHDPHRYG